MGDIIKFPVNRTWPAIRKQMNNGFSAIDFVKRDADINEILVMLWPETTQGKKENMRSNPDF